MLKYTSNGSTYFVVSIYFHLLQASETKQKLETKLGDVKFISIGADIWKYDFLGATFHFIDKDWLLQSYSLALKHVVEK